jgi:hypothetical protein
VVPNRKKAGADLAVGGDADATAVTAEGMRNRSDDSDFANAVVEVIPSRGFAARVRDLDQRAILRHALDNFIQRDHRRGRPGSVFLERHEFDKANDDAFFTSKHAEGDDLIFIEAAHEHAVNLDRPKPRTPGGANSRQHLVISVGHARDASKAIGIDRIHANGDAIQASILERQRQLREQVTVGGHRKIEVFTVEGTQLCQLADEINHAAAQQGLSPGEADFLDPERRRDASYAQIDGKRQVAIEGAFVARATVDTLVVATIRNRDAEIGDGAAEFVSENQFLAPGL